MKVMHVVLGVLLAGAVAGAVWKTQQPAVVVTDDEHPSAAEKAAEDAAYERAVKAAGASTASTAAFGAAMRRANVAVLDLKGHEKRVTTAAFSPDGKRLASGSADGTVRVWSIPEGKQVLRIDVPGATVMSVAWSADGKRLVSGGWDFMVSVWDAQSGALLDRHKQDQPVYGARFVGADRMVSGCGDSVRWWKMGEEQMQLEVALEDNKVVTALDVTPAGEVVAGDAAGMVVVLDGETGAEVERKMRPRTQATGDAELVRNWVPGLKVQADGRVLLDDLSGVWLWDRKKGEVNMVLNRRETWVAGLSPDGQVVVAATGVLVGSYDAITTQGLGGAETPGGTANAIAISPTGEFYAVASGGVEKATGEWVELGEPGLQVFDLAAAERLLGRVRSLQEEEKERRKAMEPWR